MYNKNDIIEILQTLNFYGFNQCWNPATQDWESNVFEKLIQYSATSQVVNEDEDDALEFISMIKVVLNLDCVSASYNAIAVNDNGRMTTITCNTSCKCTGPEVSKMISTIISDLCHPASYTITQIPAQYHPVVFAKIAENKIRQDNQMKNKIR